MDKKKRLMILGSFTIFFVLTLSGCTQDNQNNSRYVNTNYGFEIIPPTGWITNENTLDPVKFFCPDQNDYQINLAVRAPITSNETLGTLFEQIVEQYSTNFFKNFTLISSNHTTINGLDAYELVYSEGQMPYMLQHKQVFIEKNNKIFTIIYTSLVTTYSNYISVVDESISTFTVI